MEFLSERILRLAGLGDGAQTLNEGLAEEAVQTHQPYTTDETIETKFHSDEDDDKDINEMSVDYAIKESREALVESRLRDAIRQGLKQCWLNPMKNPRSPMSLARQDIDALRDPNELSQWAVSASVLKTGRIKRHH